MSSSDQFVAIESFIKRFNSHQEEWASFRSNDFETRFTHMRHELEVILALEADMERQTSPNFNVFRLLGVENLEVNTHSALLAELLDPSGNHSQTHLFLKKFLAYCATQWGDNHLFNISRNCEKYDWHITTEKNTAYGNLDLVVTSYDAKLIIVIENKIWASEGHQQLMRYGKWLQRQRSDMHKILIYLTPYGTESITHNGTSYYKLSYTKDIMAWIDDSMKAIASSPVKEVIKQYLGIINF
jgi:hypothetical protein